MIQYNTLTFSQLNKLKSGMKIGTLVTLELLSNIIGNSNNQNNVPYKLLLTNVQVSRLRNAFANGSSANIKLSETQLHKKGQLGGSLGIHLGSLLKSRLPLMKDILKPLAKSVLIPLELTAAASAANAAITARKTILSFSRRPEKTVFPKKLRWNLIFLVLLGKIIFLFPENMILPTNGK